MLHKNAVQLVGENIAAQIEQIWC